MAQIIKHRRGSLESLSTVTGSLQKGEIVIASGSSNITASNGNAIAFIVPQDGQVQATNRIIRGTSAPNTFPANVYNGMLNGVPYYASSSTQLPTLFLLGSGENEAINLVGNIQPFSASVSTAIGALSASLGSGGAIGTRVSGLESFTGSYATTGSNTFTGTQNLGSNHITLNGGNLQTANGGIELFSTNFAQLQYNGSSYIWVDSNGAHLEANGNIAQLDNSGNLILPGYTLPNAHGSANQVLSNNGSGNLSWVDLVNSASVATSFSASAASVSQLSASVASVTGDFSSSVATSFSASAATQSQFSASVSSKLTEIGVVSGSLIASASTAKSTNDAQAARLDSLETFSGSQLTRNSALATITGSLIATASNHEGRLGAIEAVSGTFARTNSGNVFTGTQVITGSLYITQDLVVYGSSSLLNVTASRLNLGDNTIVLNTATPAVRFGGIDVIDSGSTGATGSLYWDSLENRWLYVHPSGSGERYNSAILISGPQNSGSIGNEVGITPGKLVVAVGNDHIGDSIITQASDNQSIAIGGNVIITGSLTVGASHVALLGGDNLVTASSQIIISQTTGYGDFSGSISASLQALSASVGSGAGVSIANLNSFSASALGRLSNIESFSSSVETKLGEIAVVSGSLIASASAAKLTNDTQDTLISNLNSFSSSQLTKNSTLATYTASVETRLTEIGVVSGSLISSASAASVSIANLNSFSSSANSKFTEIGVVSGSLISSASAAKSTNDTQDGRLNNLESTSASVNTSVSNLNTFSSSVLTQLTQIGVVSGSLISSASAAKSTNDTQDGKLSNLEAKSASVDTSISNINTFTSSANSRLTVLEGTGSIQGLGTGNNVTFAKVTTTGDVVVGGDLVVQGNTVTLNTSQLVIEDKLITLASGSTSSATADGAGFEVAGTNANFVYQHSTTAFTSSVAVIAPAVTASLNVPSNGGNSKRIAFRDTNDNINFVTAPTTVGDILQYNGTDFVMSNTIDGGSF